MNSLATKKMRHVRGFTLVELLVVVAVIIFVSAMIFANNNKFGGQALLQNLAYDIALSVREAQVYGISVKGAGSSFSAGYGMHFSLATVSTYNLYADTKNAANQIVPDGLYEAGEDVSPSPYVIGRGFYISKLCVTSFAMPVEDCTPTSLDILFVRPEPDAYISIGVPQYDGAGQIIPSTYAQARVVATSPRGDVMSILISSNGQISVNNSN
jgi:prepilin-type N-terminal cleavage/methylation domain-containing protein